MKIFFVITTLGVGGAEVQLVNVVDELCKRGYVIQIACLTGRASVFPQDKSVAVHELGIEKRIGSVLSAYVQLREIIKKFNPDIVHSHMVHANLFTRLVRLSLPMNALICTAHNTNEGGFFRMLMYRITDFLADLSTNVSQEAVEAFEKKMAVPRGRMLVTLNGINCEKFQFNPEHRQRLREKEGIGVSQRVILAVGRFAEEKDYPNMIDAFQIIHKDFPEVFLWIAGDGPLRKEIEANVFSKNLEKYVKFLGIRSDVPELMSCADIFLLSSAWEGFGLVVGEAMATERVVVATDCGGVKEVLGEYGYLVPPKDPYKLSTAVRSALLLSEMDASKIGKGARGRVLRSFSLEKAVECWDSIYLNIKD